MRLGIKSVLFTSLAASVLLTGCFEKEASIDTLGMKNSSNMHKATMRPYSVFGKKYYPSTPSIGQTFTGVASWYGPNFHNKRTSNGEIYDMYALTAAHKTLPMNTVVRVDNLDNGKNVVVRVNDRGPFVNGRIIDLSNKAAGEIGMKEAGTANVRLTVLGFEGQEGMSSSNQEEAPVSQVVQQETVVQEVVPVQQMQQEVVQVQPEVEVINTVQEETVYPVEQQVVSNEIQTNTNVVVEDNTQVVSNNTEVVENNTSSYGLYNIQVGSFAKLDNANKTKAKYQNMFPSSNIAIKKVYSQSAGINFYRVLIKGFQSKADAQRFKSAKGLYNTLIKKD